MLHSVKGTENHLEILSAVLLGSFLILNSEIEIKGPNVTYLKTFSYDAGCTNCKTKSFIINHTTVTSVCPTFWAVARCRQQKK